MYIYIYMCVCMYICIHTHIYTYTHIYVYTYICSDGDDIKGEGSSGNSCNVGKDCGLLLILSSTIHLTP